jgi:hypothetical protein
MLRTWVILQLKRRVLPHPSPPLTYGTAHVSQGAPSSSLSASVASKRFSLKRVGVTLR